jgi:acyl-coenzyme A synthetase/AMP-(fatty) acid ligase/acyl carrier protein
MAYLFYTSGSTGQPKGVCQTHLNLLHFVCNYSKSLGITCDDRLSLLSPLSFSASNMDIYSSVLNGATVCPYDIRRRGMSKLEVWLEEKSITVLHAVPTLFRHLIGNLPPGWRFSKIRAIDLGGETMYTSDIRMYQEHFKEDCVLVNHLAATEASVIAQHRVDRGRSYGVGMLPVGRPADGVRIRIVREDESEADVGEIGEIMIHSPFLSPGYWRRPDLTERAFLPDPNGGDERIYRTGDLGRMLPDGCLVHLGRKDFQVKVRGYRIEVAEIEIALLDLASIRQAVVVPWGGQSSDQHLVAYLVPAGQHVPTVTELRRSLGEILPEYMIPSAFVMLDALPLTSSGKIDRRALPVPDRTRPELESAFVTPRTPIEEVLAGIWEDVLGLERIGVHDNFFELGGHSLVATRVISRVRAAFRMELPLRSLFEAPTVADLAERIETLRWAMQHLSPPTSATLQDAEEGEL